MGKALAIKGHKTRGKEVIELLEMLGGSNINNLSGDKSYAYYVNAHQNIIRGVEYIFGNEDMLQFFTIEKFLEKYPYKVGDKVHIYVQNDDIDGRSDIVVAEITSMRWDHVRCKIAYKMKDINREFYKEEIKCKVDDNSNKQSECEKCGLHFGLVQCFYKDCPHNTPKSYAVGLKDDKVIECEVNKEIVMNENKPLFKTGDVVKLKGCPDKNLFWIVMDVIKDGYIFNNGKKYSFDDQHHFEKSNREVINIQPNTTECKIAYLSINNEDYDDQIEIDLGDNYEYKFEMNKLYIVKKKPKYPKTYEECCDVLNIPNDERYIDIDVPLDYNKVLSTYVKLLICRKAYWKIAGDEMGLGKPWEPKFGKYIHYSINFYLYKDSFELHKGEYNSSDNRILVFPTEEMRDAFCENFKDLIQDCKELL